MTPPIDPKARPLDAIRQIAASLAVTATTPPAPDLQYLARQLRDAADTLEEALDLRRGDSWQIAAARAEASGAAARWDLQELKDRLDELEHMVEARLGNLEIHARDHTHGTPQLISTTNRRTL